MNKWVKYGIAGLVMTATNVAFAGQGSNLKPSQPLPELNEISVDAMDFAGGSKLKDRMLQVPGAEEVQLVRIHIQA